MRFTPTKACKIKAGKVFSRAVSIGASTTCRLFVCADAGGSPGSVLSEKTYVPSTRDWDQIDLPAPVQVSSDFWVGYQIPLRGGSDSVYVTLDAQANYPDFSKASADFSTWATPDGIPGDIMVRAIIEYEAVEETVSDAKILTLNQNFPNPVLRKANISYTLPSEMNVKLEIFDATGQVVNTLVNETQSAGNKELNWNRTNSNGENVSSGVYFYRLTAGNKTVTKTMTVL